MVVKLGMVVLYLGVLVGIGIAASRRMKDVREYFAAGKKLGFLAVAVSARATGESAWLLLGLRFHRLTTHYDAITVPDYLEGRARCHGDAAAGVPSFRYLWRRRIVVGSGGGPRRPGGAGPRMRALVFIVAVLGMTPAFATDEASAEAEEAPAAEPRRVPRFEISLGDSTLFKPAAAFEDVGSVIPTSSFLFMGEYFFTYAWRAIAVVNLPISTEQVLVNGDLVLTKASPTFALGVNFSPWGVDFAEVRRFEIHIAAMGGMQINANPDFFPLLAARLYLLHGEDIGLYVGSAFAFRLDTLALIWGLGYRF